jgi:hypothetical protein
MVPCGAAAGGGAAMQDHHLLLLSLAVLFLALANMDGTPFQFAKPLLSKWDPIWVRSANF